MSIDDPLPGWTDNVVMEPADVVEFELIPDSREEPEKWTAIETDRQPTATRWITAEVTLNLEAMR